MRVPGILVGLPRGRRAAVLCALAVAAVFGLGTGLVLALRPSPEPVRSPIAVELAALRAHEDGILGSAAPVEDGHYRVPIQVAMDLLVARPELLHSAFSAQALAADPLVAAGQQLFATKICFTCHSIDGTPLIGPTFKDMLGARREMPDGTTITVDEEYVRQSITAPLAGAAKGYVLGTMPPVVGGVTEQELAALVAFIRSVSPGAGGAAP